MPTVIAHQFEYSPAFGGWAARWLLSDRQEVKPDMAGHRRRTGRQLSPEEKVQNRREFFGGRLARSRGIGNRLRVLVDELISALDLVGEGRQHELAGLVEERIKQAREDAYSDVLAGADEKKWWVKS